MTEYSVTQHMENDKFANKSCGFGTSLYGQTTASVLAESLFYLSLFVGAFFHLFIYIPNFAPALLVLAAGVALLADPDSLRNTLLPLSAVILMAIVDIAFYSFDLQTIKPYLFWAIGFCICMSLQKYDGFFYRAKIVLLVYVFAHLIFLTPHPRDVTRMGLNYDSGLGLANPNDLATWCGFGYLLSLVGFTDSRGLWRAVWAVTAMVCMAVLLSTVSRSALLAAAASSIVYLLYIGRTRKGIFQLFLILLVLATGIALFRHQVASDVLKYEQRQSIEKGNPGDAFSGRWILIQEAERQFFDNFWLGTGKSFMRIRGMQGKRVPHNFLLGVTIHYGILPAIPIVMLWLIIWWKVARIFCSKGATYDDVVNYGELVAFCAYIFAVSNFSDLIMTHAFATLYLTKIWSLSNYSEGGWPVSGEPP
jgi:hypothetical protein